MKTILLCDKATLIPLCETCKAGPPTAAPCQRESCVSTLSVPPTVVMCAEDGHLYTCVSVNMSKYVPPTKLCVCSGLCGRDVRFLRKCKTSVGSSWSDFGTLNGGSFKVPGLRNLD